MVKLNRLDYRSHIFMVLISLLIFQLRCRPIFPDELIGPWNPNTWDWDHDVESYSDMNDGGGDDDNGGSDDDDSGSHGGKNKKKGSGDGDCKDHKDKGKASDAKMNGKLLDLMGEPCFGYKYGYHAGNENGTPVGELKSTKEIQSLVSNCMFCLSYLFPICVD